MKKRYYERKVLRRLTMAINATITAWVLGTMPVGYALPSLGSHDLPGGVTITPETGTGNTMTISSDIANNVLKWESFSIGTGETVEFTGSGQAFLNYVTGSNRSEILGTLRGLNKSIYLINPHGILFGAGAIVNVGSGSLIASTRTLTDAELNGFNGTLSPLTDAPTGGDIVNKGATLTAMNVTLEGNTVVFENIDKMASVTKPVEVVAKTVKVGYKDVNNGNASATSTLDLSSYSDKLKVINDVSQIDTTTGMGDAYVLSKDVTTAVTSPIDGQFTGLLEGAGHTVKLGIDGTGDYVGLFSQIGTDAKGGTVQNLKLTGSISVTGNVVNVGMLAGNMIKSTVTNVSNEGTVKAEGTMVNAGGIVGIMQGGSTITNASNTGKVEVSGADIGTGGGIVGYADSESVIGKAPASYGSPNPDIVNTGKVEGNFNAGGIVGKLEGTLTNAVNEADVTGEYNVGGIVGYAESGSVIGKAPASYGSPQPDIVNTGKVEGNHDVGGIVGYLKGTLTNAVNEAGVTGEENVGGLVGTLDGGKISQSYNIGNIMPATSSAYTLEKAGGIVGEMDGGTVSEVFNIGNVSKVSLNSGYNETIKDVGGIAGYVASGTISDAYNMGEVGAAANDTGDAITNIGGIAGNLSGTLTRVYNGGNVVGTVAGPIVGSDASYRNSTAFFLWDASINTAFSNRPGATPLAQMKSASTFGSWGSRLNATGTGNASTAVWRMYNDTFPMLNFALTGANAPHAHKPFDLSAIKGNIGNFNVIGAASNPTSDDTPTVTPTPTVTVSLPSAVSTPEATPAPAPVAEPAPETAPVPETAPTATPAPAEEGPTMAELLSDYQRIQDAIYAAASGTDSVDQGEKLKDKHAGVIMNSTHSVRHVATNEEELAAILKDADGVEFTTEVTGETKTETTNLDGYFDGDETAKVES